MAPKRRTSTPTTTMGRGQAAQSTLSFHKQGPNRIIKPGAQRDEKSTKDVKVEAEVELPPTTAEIAIVEQVVSAKAEEKSPSVAHAKTEVISEDIAESHVKASPEKRKSVGQPDIEARARKITDAQIKKYWQAKEAERKAPRVHQEGLSIQEKLLREFDMSITYGPCIGIARLKRWKRANMLKLSPPLEVLAVLLKESDKSNSAVQRAHVDELLSSRFIET